jgi:hypothetical protein
MTIALVVAAVLFVGWILMNLKTSRPDGTHLGRLHPYRKMMFYLMRGRNESIVYFDIFARAEKLLEYLAEAKQRGLTIDVTHCLVGAVAVGLSENPKMNRFVVGRRMYQRNDRIVSFSMKRKQKDREAKLSVGRMVFKPGETFPEVCARVNERIGVERTDARTYTDKELDVFGLVPRPVLDAAVRFVRWLDHHNLYPKGMIDTDPMYTSCFIANLGSLGMGAAYHHLYEWGNCPLFMMVGAIEDRPVVEDGKLAIAKILHIRWSYDERIDDGLNARFGMDSVQKALEDPYTYFGGFGEGAAAPSLDRPPRVN